MEGRLKTDKYEDKGNPRFYTKVVVIGLEFRIVPGGRQNKYPDKPHDNHHIQRKHPLTRIDLLVEYDIRQLNWRKHLPIL